MWAFMKFRLKDRELQRRLDEISNGDFSKKLNSSRRQLLEGMFEVFFIDPSEPCRTFHVCMADEDLEAVPVFDPEAWNDFPDVTPPEGLRCAIEFQWKAGRDHGKVQRTCWTWKKGAWRWSDGRPVGGPVDDDKKNIRFRPWGDYLPEIEPIGGTD